MGSTFPDQLHDCISETVEEKLEFHAMNFYNR